jgi:hypothetical protein
MAPPIKFLLSIPLALVLSGSSCYQKMPDYVIIQPRADAGFFSTMDDALAILQHFDAGHPLGVTFDFGQLGLYYDPAHSANWWEYYFKPMRLGDTSSKAQIIYLYDYMPFITHRMSRDEANKFIHKYIHIRPEINEKVNDFVTKNFANHFVIGVHYRGTDKVTEVPLVSYQVVAQRLASEIAALKRADYRVFVAIEWFSFLVSHGLQTKIPFILTRTTAATNSEKML